MYWRNGSTPAAAINRRAYQSSAALLLSAAFLSLTLIAGGDARFAAAAAACYFIAKTQTRQRLFFTCVTFILLSVSHWGALFSAALLFAALLAELWVDTHRYKQVANLAAAALCMTSLLFSGIPAISAHVDSTPLNPLLLLGLPALIGALQVPAVKAPSSPPLADPLLIILLTALTMCFALIVALLAVSINYPQAILLAAAGGCLMLAAVAVLTAPFFRGGALSTLQHIFILHVPIETWVSDISAAAAKETNAAGFAAAVIEQFVRLPGITGARWRMNHREQLSGEDSKYYIDLHCPPLFIRLYRRRRATPWDWFNYYLLARIAGEYCNAKQREEDQRADNLSRAVHQTGARLTHDIKNILHTLTALAQAKDSALIKHQLPVLRERLETTLAKLQTPAAAGTHSVLSADVWWARARSRHLHQPVTFSECALSGDVPAEIFDLALDNFISNAVIKHQSDHHIHIRAGLHTVNDKPALQVEDSGRRVAAETAASLFRQPVDSSTGFGVALYQVQLEADKHGYCASLHCNEDGNVIFRLAARQ